MATKQATRRLEFPKRPAIQDGELARRRIWRSRCGVWAVVHSVSKFGLPDTWNILRQAAAWEHWTGWKIVARRRARKAAFDAAQRLAREAG